MFRKKPEIKDLALAGFIEVKGFPEIIEGMYYVNYKGDVYSKYKNNLIKPEQDKDGYLRISLRTKDGRNLLRGVHQLVIHTFKGEPPKDMVHPTIDHIDRNNLNNSIENLRYLSNHDNIMHRIPARGEYNGGNIYSEDKIKSLIDYKIKHPEIGCYTMHNKFGVSVAQIFRIIKKEIWKYLTQNVAFDILNYFEDKKRYSWGYKNEEDEINVCNRDNKMNNNKYVFFDNEYTINDIAR